MSPTVKALERLLRVMKQARELDGRQMHVWANDVSTVEAAIKAIKHEAVPQ